jgi:hypothetical protein
LESSQEAEIVSLLGVFSTAVSVFADAAVVIKIHWWRGVVRSENLKIVEQSGRLLGKACLAVVAEQHEFGRGTLRAVNDLGVLDVESVPSGQCGADQGCESFVLG